MSGEPVLLLAGATASGKTELAIELACAFEAEIVGADSRQVYRGMSIGTAVPTAAQRALVPHHLIEILDPRERYSAARFAHDALAAIRAIQARGRRAIVAGGTGFYLRALRGGVDLAPQYDEGVRERLTREAHLHPPEVLYQWLQVRDPVRAAALQPRDTYRVVRALEIALAPRSAFAPVTERSLSGSGLDHALVVLDVPIAQVDARIERRAEAMLVAGFVEEAEAIGGEAIAANAVGYPQARAYARGWSTRGELHTALARSTRRYARRQVAWFRHEPGAIWLPAEAVAAFAREKLGWDGKAG